MRLNVSAQAHLGDRKKVSTESLLREFVELMRTRALTEDQYTPEQHSAAGNAGKNRSRKNNGAQPQRRQEHDQKLRIVNLMRVNVSRHRNGKHKNQYQYQRAAPQSPAK